MRGRGRAWGAVSFLNALPTGIGAAAAISLHVEVTASLAPEGRSGEPAAGSAPTTPIALESVRAACRRFGLPPQTTVRLEIDSGIPPSKGLKSSSALSVAILRAIADALGRRLPAEDAARLAAEVGLTAGGSATGAFDDALAAARGGLALTQNREYRTLRHLPLDRGWSLLLWIPDGSHGPSIEWADRFRARAADGAAALEAIERGELLEALARNSELVEGVMGYRYARLRARLARAGALGAGVSGLGPTLAVVVDGRATAGIAEELPAEGRIVPAGFSAPEPGSGSEEAA